MKQTLKISFAVSMLVGKTMACKDMDDNCAGWAASGECEANPGWMLPNCQISCNSCEGADAAAGTGASGDINQVPVDTQIKMEKCEQSTTLVYNGTPYPCEYAFSQGKQYSITELAEPGQWWRAPFDGLYSVGRVRVLSRYDGFGEGLAGTAIFVGDQECGQLPETTKTNEWYNVICNEPLVGDSIELRKLNSENLQMSGIEVYSGEIPKMEDHDHDDHDDHECYDMDDNCAGWADSGECNANPDWMLPNCQMSCGQCGDDNHDDHDDSSDDEDDCFDMDENCGAWAEKGECDANPDWMHVNCHWSCGMCRDEHGMDMDTEVLEDVIGFVSGENDFVEFDGHTLSRDEDNDNMLMIEEVDGEPKITLYLQSATKLIMGATAAVSGLFMY